MFNSKGSGLLKRNLCNQLERRCLIKEKLWCVYGGIINQQTLHRVISIFFAFCKMFRMTKNFFKKIRWKLLWKTIWALNQLNFACGESTINWTVRRVRNCLDAHLAQIVCDKDGVVDRCIVLVEMPLTRFEECWPLPTESLPELS